VAVFILLTPLVLLITGTLLTLPQVEREVARMPDHVLHIPAALGPLAVLLVSLVTPASAALPAWVPGGNMASFGLNVDRVNLPFVWVIVLLCLGIVFTLPFPLSALDRRTMSETYALAAASLSLILAANPATWAVTWLAVDLVLFWTWQRSETAATSTMHPPRGLGLNMLGGMGLLAAGLTLSSPNGTLAGVTGVPTAWATFLLILAAAIRMGLYPMHWGLPLPWRTDSRSRWLQYLIPLSAGAYLVTRTVAIVRRDLPGGSVWIVIGVLGLLVAGLSAWAAHSREEGLAWLGIQQACLLLIALGLEGPQRSIFVLFQGLHLPLVSGTLAILANLGIPPWGRRLQLFVRGLTWFTAGSLLGLPPTLGFTARWALYRHLFEESWGWIVWLSSLSTALAVPAVVRLLNHRSEGTWRRNALVAIASLGLPLLILSLQPLLLVDFATAVAGGASADYLNNLLRATGNRLGFMIVLALLLPILGYRLAGEPKSRVSAANRRLSGILDLEWLSRWINQVVSRSSELVLNLLAPIGGERYLAWSIVFALVIALILLR